MRFLISRLTEPHFSKEYLATLNDPRYMRFSQHKNVQATVESQHEYLKSFDFTNNFLLAITDRVQGSLVATATLRVQPENQVINIGFLVLRSFSGKGLGKDILIELSEWVFELFPLASQQIGTRRENIAMQKISLGAGFHPDKNCENPEYIYFLKPPPPLTRLLEEGAPDFHIVCNDFGGSLHISALAKALGLRATATLSGPACEIFATNNKAISLQQITQELVSNKTILLGSGFYGGPESKALENELLLSNCKVVLLDHWINFKFRFHPNFKYLPDLFFVTNLKAEEFAREIFPNKEVIRIPDFLLAEQKKRFLSQESSPKNLLLILEPNASVGECTNYEIKRLDQYLPVLKNFAEIHGLEKVILRKHPSQALKMDLTITNTPNDIEICESSNESLVEDLLSAGAVFGFHSSALYASSMLGVDTYSFFAGAIGHWTEQFPLIMETS